jgi:chemotaxis family two-component system response regulator Rcp1
MTDRFHIIVLEDNRPDLLMVKQVIRDAGVDCEFTEFTDGDQAMAYINEPASRIPDLMILDLNIPKVEGASVLNGIRGNPRWARVHVFMFTASQDPADFARVKMLGADGCFTKPIDLASFEQIGRTVKDWLEKRATLADV